MGGELKVRSSLRKGSTFYFSLPISQPKTDSTDFPAHIRAIRTLLIEPVSLRRQSLVETFASWHMPIDTAPTLDQAMARLQETIISKRRYDVVLMDAQSLAQRPHWLQTIRCRLEYADLRFVILTSPLGNGEPKNMLRGADALLYRPVSRAALLRQLKAAARELTSEDEALSLSQFSPSDLQRPQEVLLAEDNPANQVFAQNVLRKAGHTVTPVTDGQAAVEAATSKRFDIILMDMRMPKMDGVSATRAIRQHETENRDLATPIVALTANATTQDQKACLRAGMNAFLGKPFKITELLQVVSRHSSHSIEEHLPAMALQQEQEQESAFDSAAALKYVGTLHVLKQVFTAHQGTAEEIETTLLTAAAEHDAEALHQVGHRLKGALAVLGANRATSLASELEALARTGDVPDAPHRVNQLFEAMSDWDKQITQFLEQA